MQDIGCQYGAVAAVRSSGTLPEPGDASMEKKHTREDANGEGTGTEVVLGGVWWLGGDRARRDGGDRAGDGAILLGIL